MIKFFRKIRQKMLTENKFSKYLIYAIGEIILVVIGILIALGINNWNEQVKLNKSITDHLEILEQNIIEDQLQLQELKLNITERKLAADSAMLQMMTLEPIDIQLKKYLIMLYQEFTFSPNTNAIETINQSNEIPFLNSELRTAILDYYSLIDRTKEREHISNTQIQTKYEPYLNEQYPTIFQKNNKWDFVAKYYKNDPRPTSMIDKDKFLNDKTLETLLVSRYYQSIALEKFYEDLIISSDKILSRIKK
ncbi:DUF6090 family protein [Arenibacter sp. GZD96]|uniref:DUF6090 family protein n=1 Tax=Aurantibrevibacter litoralis TaxID=3106030 RepID=UPI002AFDF12D|nr:DUF6090 family protein [Arenibacter sp. GZD-96]MEA1787748.1 DUF6090 family protein [Arenibacter sp. GZD-96]